MARGYPTPKARDEPVPQLLPEGVCIFCKRRPATVEGYKCPSCAEALAR